VPGMRKHVVLGLLLAGAWVGAGWMGCSASGMNRASEATGTGAGTGMGGGSPTGSAHGGGGIILKDSGNACPSTCAELGANCGAVTDAKCGGVVQCGSCASGQTCGGDGTHNVCGTGTGNPDGCAPLTCAAQGVSCGPAGDGCNGTLQCGACNAPQSCGGDPTQPGACGCTGTCALVPTCTGGTTTTLTGTVYDPAGIHPLYSALVYIPNDPTDPGLQPFTAGITCDQCGATAAGNPLVSTLTAPDGTFTLTNVPVGSSLPLVVQLGRWRRQFTVNVATSCGANSVPAHTLSMPKDHTQGDIPRIGILSGGFDPVECVLRKMGISDSEFTDPGGGGHINFYLAGASAATIPSIEGSGASIDSATPPQSSLFASQGGTPVINQYDMVILECEGYPQPQSAGDLAAVHAYAEGGGRVFVSDYAYTWLYQNANFAQAAAWHVDQDGNGLTEEGIIDLVSNPKGMAFDQWLEIVGASPPGSHNVGNIFPVFHNTDAVVAPTQQWLYWGSSTPMHFTFNTPVGAAAAQQCGRVVYSDWHAETNELTHDTTFPQACPSPSTPMTAQEAILEFMLFDLSACVEPYTPVCTPKTCAGANIQCGPASDGCGNLLQCGACAGGQTCGGGGPGQCGTSSSCPPETCASQNIACGPAGDGCGDTIQCGNCPTGEICGANGPGQCGKVQ
jgi:hypothetical protein